MGNELPTDQCCQANKYVYEEVDKYNQIQPALLECMDDFANIESDIPIFKTSRHRSIVSLLRKRSWKFTDKYFNIESSLGTELPFTPKHKRLSEVYPNYQIHNNGSYEFNYHRNTHSLAKDNFVFALVHLQKYPKLLNKIFIHQQMQSQGFYVLYFGLHGNVKDRVEVVIDDYILLDRKYQYLFGRPMEKIMWMILLEKALAKVVRSFNNIRYLTSGEIFEEVTGVPLLNKKVLEYNPDYFLSSYKQEFPFEESVYFKFTIDHQIQAIFVLWENLRQLYAEYNGDYTPFVIQLFNEEKKTRLVYAKNRRKNKLFVSNDDKFLSLDKGAYVIHVYNRSYFTKNINLVVYASQRIDIHLRKQANFQSLKKQAIFNFYKNVHNSIKPLYEDPEIIVRFYWDHYRGIMCLKNQSNKQKDVEISIHNMYQKDVFFEYQKDKKSIREKNFTPQKHMYVYFLRRRDEDVGRFYKVKVHLDQE